MKRLFTLLVLCLVLGIGAISAQNQRVVVLECFTSATCGPCASANPALDNLINKNPDNLIAIKYHVYWPYEGDPMNLHNPNEVASRVSYYNVTGVPTSIADGTWNGNSGNVTQNLVNQWAAVTSPLEMRMSYYLNDTQDTINVIVMGRATEAITSSNLKLNIAVLEKTMTYTSAPCAHSNGERVFHNVMKKMLPSSGGTMVNAMQAGDYFAYKYSWALANVMNVNELTAVAWLQDSNTKHVFQGCMPTDNFEPYYAKQAMISDLDHMMKKVCSGTQNPFIMVDNLGSETINSLTINVTSNGNNVAQINWEGNIESCHSAKIYLGELNFDVESNNQMNIEISAINGAPDDYEPSIYSYAFNSAPVVENKTIKVTIRTDNNPEAITWDIVNTATGNTVANGGPYSDVHHMYTENVDLEENGCYRFTIYDATGDGLSGGSGLYGLKAGSTTLFSGGNFTDREANEFSFIKNVGIEETTANTANIYPNPSHGIVTVETASNGVLSVYNTTGQLVYNQKIEGQTTVDVSNIEKGAYLFVVTDDNGNNSKQIIVLQ